ncbi:ThiF family adenylyltransferase [Maribacter sp. 2210JD10-5]|uniref:ThiF family adenylyltransferase n=1 Tax=Maribacter sp. 2210JD10-5 TaxID=3386272 RepID=UPI0039BCBF34
MKTARYDRQRILKGFGEEGQAKLKAAKILVVGAGGLGVPVLTYLNAMGVGTLGIADADLVSESNLHRQVIYKENQIGLPKVEAIKDNLQAQNSETIINVYKSFLTIDNALEIIANYDVVVDASDNFPTRYLVNDACVILKKPLVYGALHGFEGQVSVFNYDNGPTYRCLFPKMPKVDAIPNCNEHGILGVLPGIIGNLQALETVKVITEIGEVLSGVLFLYDGLSQRTQRMQFNTIPENLELSELQDSYELDCNIPVKSIEAIEIEKLITDFDIELIDVRTKEEFVQNHLAKAKHIPLLDLKQRKKEIDTRKPVYVICQSGIRSLKAAVLLKELLPNTEIINVSGGMNQLSSYADFS